MNNLSLGRRDFLHLAFLATCFGLSGCQVKTNRRILSCYQDILPDELIESLPDPWLFKELKNKEKDLPYNLQAINNIDLLAIGDGWLQNLVIDNFSTILLDDLNSMPFNKQAKEFMYELEPEYSSKLMPIGMSPWVMLFRRGESWISQARESWDVLLDPGLKGELILPSSPRVTISLADRIGGKETLSLLRRQVKAYDDRNAMNWLLAGRAKVVVLPLQHCINNLSKDPRLAVAIPLEGAPLNWTFLVKPIDSKEPFPSSWIQETYEPPLISKLFLRGWIPPLSYPELSSKIDSLKRETSLFTFSEKQFNNFWSLRPVDISSIKSLQERWINSTP